tara:strand:+ start:80 stop:808 length:729 start_codon:yes stop_codon:yes gene_type:complete
MKKKIIENIKTIIFALSIAMIIRSLLFQPFLIPSSSMEPTLLVGDRLFVSKFAYGYSRHSFPFSPGTSNKRFYNKKPSRGDVIVFKTPADNRTDYIKRLIGIPGDTIQIINGLLYINDNLVKRKKIPFSKSVYCGDSKIIIDAYEETLPNDIKYIAVYSKIGTMMNTDKFSVPKNKFFFMGDNRDCSKDSRYLSSVGYVDSNNLVGKAKIIFFSTNNNEGNIFEFWKWKYSLRIDRFLSKIK